LGGVERGEGKGSAWSATPERVARPLARLELDHESVSS